MKKLSLFLILWIPMYLTAQSDTHGKPNSDTVKCYGIHELQYIAATLAKKHACDTLLSTAHVKIQVKDSTIKQKDFQIDDLVLSLRLQDERIKARDTAMDLLEKKFNKSEKKRKLLKFGWGGTTVILGASILYLIFTH